MKYLRLTNGCWNKTCTFGGRGFYKEETDAIQDINASALVIFVVGVFTATPAAQSVELYPYAGGFWPSRVVQRVSFTTTTRSSRLIMVEV